MIGLIGQRPLFSPVVVCAAINKWINMAKIENTFEAICDFMARNQFLGSCSRELNVH